MICAYAFMTIVYFALWFALFFFVFFFPTHIPWLNIISRTLRAIPKEFRPLAIVQVITALGIYTYPILLTTLFNYSQYLYYGDNFIDTLSDEFNMRDTKTYIRVLRNSINQKFHTILDFF
jgi:hypothetical protein